MNIIFPIESLQHISQSLSLQFNHFNILLTSGNTRHHRQTVLNLPTHPRNFHTQTVYDWQYYVSSFPLGDFATQTEPLGSPSLKHRSTKCGLHTPLSPVCPTVLTAVYLSQILFILTITSIFLEEVIFIKTVIQVSCALYCSPVAHTMLDTTQSLGQYKFI